MRSGLKRDLALAAMNGCQVRMVDMGPGSRRRERKRDQDDRRSQNPNNLLLQHDGSIVAQAPLDIAGEPEVQGPGEIPTRGVLSTSWRLHVTTLCRQISSDRRQKENRDVDRESEAPQDRAQRRAVAEIGEDIGDPHNEK